MKSGLSEESVMISSIGFFAIIGAIGFFVDAMVLKLFLLWIEDDPILGRGISFPIAATVTWLLNRRYTFIAENGNYTSLYREWLAYILVNSIGFGVNLIVFILAMYFIDLAKLYPIVTLAFASFVAMFFNYLGSKYLVFERKHLFG